MIRALRWLLERTCPSKIAEAQRLLDLASSDRVIRDVEMLETALHRQPLLICTVNLYVAALALVDPAVRGAVHGARWLTADGRPIVTAIRLLGGSAERVTGVDLVDRLQDANFAPWVEKIALLGSTAEVVLRLEALVGNAGRRISYAETGSLADWDLDAISRGIKEADLILIALGTEAGAGIALDYVRGVDCPIVVIGGAVGMIVGDERRAPEWWQRHGGEWLWRLLLDPARLWRRYLLICVPAWVLFGALLMEQRAEAPHSD